MKVTKVLVVVGCKIISGRNARAVRVEVTRQIILLGFYISAHLVEG